VLHRHAKPVEVFDEELAELSRTMLQVMYDSGGIGLAGPQVGIDQSILVYNLFGQPLHLAATERVLINPRVIRSAPLRWTSPEGCLSLPEARGIVTRPVEVEVEAFELDGELIRQTLQGVEARVVLHEIDHLNGTPQLFCCRPCYAAVAVGPKAGCREERGERWGGGERAGERAGVAVS
jgi:peptide deformylase